MNTSTTNFAGHTPGPLRFNEETSQVTTSILETRNGESGYRVLALVHGSATKHGNANGKLFAAAPSLLAERDRLREVLKAIVDAYGLGSTPETFCRHAHEFIMEARALIAEGGAK